MGPPFRRLSMTVFASLLVIGVSGCQYSYPFEISGMVRTADGTALAGVHVTLRAQGILESSFPVVTAQDGTFNGHIRVMDSEFGGNRLPTWILELSKEGYESANVDVSPTQQPKSPRKTTVVSADGTMKVK